MRKFVRIGSGELDRWFAMSLDMLCTADKNGHFTRVNAAWERTLGWSEDEMLGRPYIEFVHPDDLEASAAEAARLLSGDGETLDFQNRYCAKDGSWHWLEWSARSDGTQIYALARDITARKEAEAERDRLLARVEAIARTDELTGLPNRRAWDEELQRELARARRRSFPVCVAVMDIDHFKAFNDEHGHQAGDSLLKEAATAWRLALRVTDMIARYGGEEFNIMLPDCSLERALRVVERIREATPLGQTCSTGCACWDGSESGEALLARADAALYVAKRSGRNRSAVAPS